jgi:hypothetical protein
MQLTGAVSDYALFVAHGRTNIRVFESSDLKDDDECELVLLHFDDDEEEDEEALESDDDDKTVPMSAEKATPEPEPEPIASEPEAEAPASKKRKSNNGKKSANETSKNTPSTPPSRPTRSSFGSSSSASLPPSRNASQKKGNKKSTSKSQKPNGLVAVTKKNQFKLEPGSLLIFDRYSDGHFHEAIVQKYLPPERQQREPDTCWVFVQDVEHDVPERQWKKNWVDLNSFKSYIVERDNIVVIDADDHEDDNSFLGKRLSVKWSDGNYYKGTVTKTLSSNTDFVFIDYDDGDQCWSNLGEELDATEISGSQSAGKTSAAKGRNA